MRAAEDFHSGIRIVGIEVEGDHRSEVAHLRGGKCMLGMIGETGVHHFAHLGMLIQVVGQLVSVFAGSFHAEVQGLDAAEDEKAILWAGHCTAGVL